MMEACKISWKIYRQRSWGVERSYVCTIYLPYPDAHAWKKDQR